MKTLLIIIISIFTLFGCKENSTDPQIGNEFYQGITETLIDGTILKVDNQDWQSDSVNVGTDTLILDLFPASPNPLIHSGACELKYGLNFTGTIEIELFQAKNDVLTGKTIENKVRTCMPSSQVAKGKYGIHLNGKYLKQGGIYRAYITAKKYINNGKDSVILKSFGDIQVAK
jgi:hypothetical protein